MPYKIVVHQLCKKLVLVSMFFLLTQKAQKKAHKENAEKFISLVATSDKAYSALSRATSPVGLTWVLFGTCRCGLLLVRAHD